MICLDTYCDFCQRVYRFLVDDDNNTEYCTCDICGEQLLHLKEKQNGTQRTTARFARNERT